MDRQEYQQILDDARQRALQPERAVQTAFVTLDFYFPTELGYVVAPYPNANNQFNYGACLIVHVCRRTQVQVGVQGQDQGQPQVQLQGLAQMHVRPQPQDQGNVPARVQGLLNLRAQLQRQRQAPARVLRLAQVQELRPHLHVHIQRQLQVQGLGQVQAPANRVIRFMTTHAFVGIKCFQGVTPQDLAQLEEAIALHNGGLGDGIGRGWAVISHGGCFSFYRYYHYRPQGQRLLPWAAPGRQPNDNLLFAQRDSVIVDYMFGIIQQNPAPDVF